MRKLGQENKQFKDFTGQKFGKLQVLGFSHFKDQPSGQRKSQWNCVCECGNTCLVAGYNLTTDHTTSCGCVQKQRTSTAKTTHGMTESTTYKTWLSMKERCTNPNSQSYKEYGGVGVLVCERWINSFENFLEDMGVRPRGMSLNRINSVNLYSKETCEWASCSLQGYDQKIRNTNTSGKTGVSYNNRQQKWCSYIHKDNKRIHLGFFELKEDAIKARLIAEIQYFGFNKE